MFKGLLNYAGSLSMICGERSLDDVDWAFINQVEKRNVAEYIRTKNAINIYTYE